MSRPTMDRASSFNSDDTSSTQSCIVVKPMRDSSPPSEASHAAPMSTPPTSLDPSPSVASEQAPSSPKRTTSKKERGKAPARLSAGRESLKTVKGKASQSSLKTSAKQSRVVQKTSSTKPIKNRKTTESTRQLATNLFSSTLDEWLVKGSDWRSKNELGLPSDDKMNVKQTLDIAQGGVKRKRDELAVGADGDDTIVDAYTMALEAQRPAVIVREVKAVASLEELSTINTPLDVRDDASTDRKRARHSTGLSEPANGDKTDVDAQADSTKPGALAAQARKAVAAARRSVRQVAGVVTQAANKISKPARGNGNHEGEARSMRRSTRDAGAPPSNEQKAATALQDDSKKRQNKVMMTRGRFYNGEPATEVFPLPNSFYLGKFGSDATYLDSMRFSRGFKLGAEVFNPQPSSFVREGKDWSVTKGAKNAFAGNARATWARSELSSLPVSFCTCKPADACGVDCWNRTMEYECSESNCAVGAALCKNRPFADLGRRLEKAEAVNNRQREHERERSDQEKRRPKYPCVMMSFDHGVEVFEAAGKGYGVRAQRSFEPGQIIMEYFGEIIDADEVDRRMATVYKDSTDFYMMQFHDGFVLDATKGSMCRFVNHSCQPNCEIRKMLVPMGAGKKASVEPRMALFAGASGIQFDEELTYDYNFDPFSNRNVQKCLCGSAKCRGFLGPRQKAPVNGSSANPTNGAGAKAKSKAADPTTAKKNEVSKATAAKLSKSAAGVLFTSSDILKMAKRARF